MALNPQVSNTALNAEANALADLLDGGYLRIYDGTQPADANTAITTQVLLAELQFSSPSESDITAGVITFDTITDETSAPASGTATWYRCLKSDGTTVVMDGSVGTSGANLNLSSVAITVGSAVSVTSFTHTIPGA